MRKFGYVPDVDGRKKAARNRLLAALHAAAKAMGLDEDAYRDKLEAVTGARSARQLTDEQLAQALDMFHGKPVSARHPHHAKVKALWIACWNIAAVSAGTDAALDAFVKRQTGVERLAFLGPQDAHKVAEALKAMLAREGCVVPSGDEGGMRARANLVAAQWAKLHRLGAVRIDAEEALMNWAYGRGQVVTCTMTLEQMKRHELDLAAKKLGVWLRRAAQQKDADHAA